MALLEVCFLLLLCSMSPLLSFGSHCNKGYYCPAGADCSSNRSLCVEGVCEDTSDGPCIDEVLMEFGDLSYSIDESAREVEIELTLDGAVDCCSISVTVIVEDGTAEEGEDYASKEHIIVKFPAGKTMASIKVTINEDKILEGDETFTVTIYELSVPYGITLGTLTTTTVTIRDNDNAILTFSNPVFYVYENDGPALPELVLNVPATVAFDVQVESSNVDLSEDCDNFQRETYTARFPNGTTRVKVPINITDDDVYEENESFYIDIIDPRADRVVVGTLSRAEVVIVNDDELITASFDQKVYRVQEHQGTLSPGIVLSEPSPCCFILHAQLSDGTAHGKTIDYGCVPPKIYNYTFHAGSTCAYPDANIKITDDMITETVESFHIRIMPFTLPFGVTPGGPATILINDNDNACWFRFDNYSVSEDESRVWVEILLGSKAASNLPIQISSTDGTATGGIDYVSGPYDVTITKGTTRKYFSIDILNDDVYEGLENFVISIATVPLGLVCDTETTIEIKDDEYIVDFKQSEYYVDEGDSTKLELYLSRALPSTITVQLEFTPILPTTSSDYYTPPRSVRFYSGVTETSVTFRTRGDSTLEDKFKSVAVVAKNPVISNGTADGRTVITIVDDDDIKIKFDKSEYISTESSPAKAKLMISRSPIKTFTAIIDQVDCDTAVGGIDYEIQDYRSLATFVKSGKTSIELPTKPIDDDIVECDKTYCLVIIRDLLPDRVIAVNPSVTKIIIRDDDKTTVTRKDEVISFSKELDRDIEIEVTYYTGLPERITLKKGSKQVTIDSSRITRIQRITIKVPCCFRSNQFQISTPRTYLVIERC